MLRRRGLSATVQLGLAKDGHGVLKAHAWSRCGELPVTGVDAAQGFTAVAVFSA
jgi:Transglutaminase-like superfamily